MPRFAGLIGRTLVLCALLALVPAALYFGGRAAWYFIFFRGMDQEMAAIRRDAAEVEASRGGHAWGTAAAADPRGITVMYSADPTGRAPETWLMRLDDRGAVRWRRRAGTAPTTGNAMVPLGGGFVIAGERQVEPNRWRGVLLRVDSAGRLLAERQVGRAGASSLDAVAVLGDGSVVAGGGQTDDWRGLLVRADTALRVEWARHVGGTERVQRLIPAPEDGFAMGALVEFSTRGLGVSRLDAYGAATRPRWTRTLPERAEIAGMAPLPAGGFVAAGSRAPDDLSPARIWAARVDAAGKTVWERDFGAGLAQAMTPLSDGGILLAASQGDGFEPGVRVIRISARGEPLWTREFARSELDYISGIAPVGDGAVLVGGTFPAEARKRRVWILRLDGGGKALWEHVIHPAHGGATR